MIYHYFTEARLWMLNSGLIICLLIRKFSIEMYLFPYRVTDFRTTFQRLLIMLIY